jgi:hypothetical protein
MNLYFHYALGFNTQTLAHMLDSLVRVSRRVNENRSVRIRERAFGITPQRLGPHYELRRTKKSQPIKGALLWSSVGLRLWPQVSTARTRKYVGLPPYGFLTRVQPILTRPGHRINVLPLRD